MCSFGEVLKVTPSTQQQVCLPVPNRSKCEVYTAPKTHLKIVEKCSPCNQGKSTPLQTYVHFDPLYDQVPCQYRFAPLRPLDTYEGIIQQDENQSVIKTSHRSNLGSNLVTTEKSEEKCERGHSQQDSDLQIVEHSPSSSIVPVIDKITSKVNTSKYSCNELHEQDKLEQSQQESDFDNLKVFDKVEKDILKPLPECAALGSDVGAKTLTPLQV